MRFDSGAIGLWSEICAYGTAVSVAPVTDDARQQYDAMVRAGDLRHQQGYTTNVSEWRSAPPPTRGPGAAVVIAVCPSPSPSTPRPVRHEPSHVPPPLASPVPPALPSLSASSSTVSTSWRMPSAR